MQYVPHQLAQLARLPLLQGEQPVERRREAVDLDDPRVGIELSGAAFLGDVVGLFRKPCDRLCDASRKEYERDVADQCRKDRGDDDPERYPEVLGRGASPVSDAETGVERLPSEGDGDRRDKRHRADEQCERQPHDARA